MCLLDESVVCIYEKRDSIRNRSFTFGFAKVDSFD